MGSQDAYEQDTPVSSGLSGGVFAVIFIFATLVVIVKICLACWCYGRYKESITQARNQVAGTTIQIHNLKGCANMYPEQHISETSMEKFLNEVVREKPIRFSQQQLEVFTQRFANVLGSGGFGIVYKGHLPHGVPIAVKVLHGSGGKRMEQQFMAEVGTIGRTYHVNLVRLYGFCFQPTMRALVYEYMENGSLDNFLFKAKSPAIEWRNLRKIAVGTAKGIEYLHHGCQQRIIHYDIKPGNVLLDRNLNPKVADFGLAKLCDKENTHIDMSGYRGTPGYAAPELYAPYHVTHKCDVYSFGMLLFEIVGRRKNHDPKLSGQSREWLPKWSYNK